MKSGKLRLALTVFGLAFVAGMLGPRLTVAAESVDAGFEDGVLEGPLWKVSGNAPVVQSKITRSGKYAMKSVLNRLTSPTNFRTEVALRGGVHTAPFFQDTWYGFSIYLPSPYPADALGEILAQWHGTGGGVGGPPLSLKLINGSWLVATQSSDAAVTTRDTKSGGRSVTLSRAAVDKWTDWVFRVHWDYRSNGSGRVTVWQDGKQVLDWSGPIGYNQTVGPYFKMGIYKSLWIANTSQFGNERVLYHDAFRVASGPNAKYEDVAPGPQALAPKAPSLVSIQ